MVDKLDLRVPRRTGFTSSFDRLYPQIRSMEKSPLRGSKYYDVAGDLREFGYDVRLNLFCRMQKSADHKIEVLDVGTKNRAQILREVSSIFDTDPAALEVMRVDLTVDVEEVPLSWFREAVRVSHKRWRAGITGERFFGEMGNRNIQTLYYGKRPNLFRIYDKMAEYRAAYQRLARTLKNQQPPPFQDLYGRRLDGPALTRVERQLGGRVPPKLSTLQKVMEGGRDFKPFETFKFASRIVEPLTDSSLPFETRCTANFLREMAAREGMQAIAAFFTQQTNGNSAWAWKKYGPFLAALDTCQGITGGELQGLFEVSMAKQFAS